MLYVAAACIALTAVLMVCAPAHSENLLGTAECLEPPESKAGNLDAEDLARRLADPASVVEWKGGLKAFPAMVEFRFRQAARPWYLVARWKWVPSDYTVEVRDAEVWREAAESHIEHAVSDKIMLHLLDESAIDGLRLVVRGTIDEGGQCGLSQLEVYERGGLPERVRRFLERPTPHLFDTPENIAARRAEAKGEEQDTELLQAEVPTWTPITSAQYGGKETGKRVNELSGRRGALLGNAAGAYANTGDPAYAQKTWDVLETEIAHYDRYQAFRFFGVNWQAVTFQEPGYVLSRDPPAYDVIADTLAPEQKLKVLYFLLDVGGFQYRAIRDITPPPEKVTSRGQIANWVPNSMGALALTACYLREFPEAQVWMREVDAKMPGVFSAVFFLEDGTWWECSPAHHAYVLRGVYKYALAKHLMGEPVWDKQFGALTLADAFEALAKTANPLGEYPSTNDSHGHEHPIRSGYSSFVRAATMMGRGDMLYAWRAEPAWPSVPGLKREAVTPEPPSYTSILMPAAGQAVLRDGWDPTDAYIFFDYGPHGGGHGQFDKLSIALVAGGHHWAPDAGCAPHYCIFPEQWNWHRQTISHSTVLVDGRSQQETSGRLIAWHTDERADLVCAEHDGNRSPAPMVIRADGEQHTLSLRPRELAPFRIGAIQMTGADGRTTSLPLDAARPQDCRLVDDPAAPMGRAIEFQSTSGVATWELRLAAGSWKVAINGNGRAGSHDSVYVDLDGRRIGECGLPDRKYGLQEPVMYETVSHRRSIFHPRGEYFLLHDTLAAEDGREHQLEWLLHVYGEPAGQAPGRIVFRHGEQGLVVASPHIAEGGVEMERGLVGGLERHRWRGEGYPGKGDPGWLYIPYFRLKQALTETQTEAHFWAAILPFEGDGPPRLAVEPLPLEGAAAAVRVITDRGSDTFVVAGGDLRWRAGDLAGGAPFAFARRGRDETVWGRAYAGQATCGDVELESIEVTGGD